MSLFCLVHGSTQNPAGWKLLVSELESRGHRCVSVDLPTNEPDASANRYADAIADAVGGMEAPMVVAHSAGGLFLPLVPARVRVAGDVYLAAVIPEIGKSFMDQFRSAPEMYCPGFVGKDPTKDPELARHFLFHELRCQRGGVGGVYAAVHVCKAGSHRDHAAVGLAGCAGILHFVQ